MLMLDSSVTSFFIELNCDLHLNRGFFFFSNPLTYLLKASWNLIGWLHTIVNWVIYHLPLSCTSILCVALCWYMLVITPVKFLVAFVKDPSDKRKIICDEKLKELFDVDSFNGFTVTKLLAPHFIKTQQWVGCKLLFGQACENWGILFIKGSFGRSSLCIFLAWSASRRNRN